MTSIQTATLLLLAGCAASVPSVQAAPPATAHEVPAPRGLTAEELAESDPRGAVAYTEALVAKAKALSPSDAAAAQAAFRRLQVTCLYNRATAQLPHVLLQLVNGLPEEAIGAEARWDVYHLRQGLQAQVAFHDAVAGELATPRLGDHLHLALAPELAHTLASLQGAADPLGDTEALLDGLSAQFEVWDQATRDQVEDDHQTLHDLFGPWPAKVPTRAWGQTLRRMQPFVVGAAHQTTVQRMLSAIDRLSESGC